MASISHNIPSGPYMQQLDNASDDDVELDFVRVDPPLEENKSLPDVKDRLWTVVYGEKPLSKSVAGFFGFKSKMSLADQGLQHDTMLHLIKLVSLLPQDVDLSPQLEELNIKVGKAIQNRQTLNNKRLSRPAFNVILKISVNGVRNIELKDSMEQLAHLIPSFRNRSYDQGSSTTSRQAPAALASSKAPASSRAPENNDTYLLEFDGNDVDFVKLSGDASP